MALNESHALEVFKDRFLIKQP